MRAYIKDCNVNEIEDRNIIYVVEYDNGEAYPENHFREVEAVFSEYKDVLKFMDKLSDITGYHLVKHEREDIVWCLDDGVKYLKILQEEWHSEAEDDYYDPVGYYIVEYFNKETGYALFNTVEIVKMDE